MQEEPGDDRVRTTVTISPANSFTKDDLRNWIDNLLKFAAPTMIVFFGQLAAGVPLEKAWPIALLAFYQSVHDFWKKYKTETVTR